MEGGEGGTGKRLADQDEAPAAKKAKVVAEPAPASTTGVTAAPASTSGTASAPPAASSASLIKPGMFSSAAEGNTMRSSLWAQMTAKPLFGGVPSGVPAPGGASAAGPAAKSPTTTTMPAVAFPSSGLGFAAFKPPSVATDGAAGWGSGEPLKKTFEAPQVSVRPLFSFGSKPGDEGGAAKPVVATADMATTDRPKEMPTVSLTPMDKIDTGEEDENHIFQV